MPLPSTAAWMTAFQRRSSRFENASACIFENASACILKIVCVAAEGCGNAAAL
jgi:hypothetical protein